MEPPRHERRTCRCLQPWFFFEGNSLVLSAEGDTRREGVPSRSSCLRVPQSPCPPTGRCVIRAEVVSNATKPIGVKLDIWRVPAHTVRKA